ncbi:hypothetical protein N7G274_005507 [Stereocaulon virgatum]|uniref:Uncharacterized protein n=1 Tax=Stereocaulon virgatum TaxID=373712 RepID=A0ABR4AEB3_9LECA
MTAQEAPTALASQETKETVFQQLESYPWASDPEFQSGLRAILGQDPSPEQAQHLTLRARCFYFSRKNNIPVDFNAYQTWRGQQTISSSIPNGASPGTTTSTSSTSSSVSSDPTQAARHEINATNTSSEPPAPYPTSFSQIVELITHGQPIPGIKEVPDTVLQGQASHATTTKRKKPWEKDHASGGEDISTTTINA